MIGEQLLETDMRFLRFGFIAFALAFSSGLVPARAAEETLRVGVFRVEVSTPLGSPAAYAPARKIEDPLGARGIVLLGWSRVIFRVTGRGR